MAYNKKTTGIIAIAAIIILTIIYISSSPSTPSQTTVVTHTSDQSSEMTANSPESMVMNSEPAAGASTESSTDHHKENIITIDVEKALEERALGDVDAPLTIEEYASLSCNHCAYFSNEIFPKFKKDYIETGKVRFIYHDYPLNAPAMDGAMIARCMPKVHYFKFIKFLFESQESWAFDADYRKNLLQKAKLLGTTEELFNACLDNQELKQGLIANMQKAAKDHNIQSTPSFIMNGTELIKGAHDFESFKAIIDEKLKESSTTE